MSTEKFSNNATTVLNGAINNSVSSLVVNSASGFPTSGNFRIIIDSEIIKVTAVSGTTFTINRAQESTSAASHSNGASVTHILTKEALSNLRSDFIIKDDLANRPSSEINGRLFLPNDSLLIHRDNGSSWDQFGLLTKMVPPIASAFSGYSWVNQGVHTTFTNTQDYSILAVDGTNPDVSNNCKLYVGAYPTPPFTWTIQFQLLGFLLNYGLAGLCFYNSGSGKFVTWHFEFADNEGYLHASKWTNYTTFSASYRTAIINTQVGWLRFTDNGTNRIYEFSLDGINFITITTSGRTDFVTPDKAGLFINCINGYPCSFIVASWLQT